MSLNEGKQRICKSKDDELSQETIKKTDRSNNVGNNSDTT